MMDATLHHLSPPCRPVSGAGTAVSAVARATPPGARVPGEWCAGLRSHSGTKPGQVSSQGCTFLARRRPRPEGRKRAAGAAAGRLLLRLVSVARDHDMAVSAG